MTMSVGLFSCFHLQWDCLCKSDSRMEGYVQLIFAFTVFYP